jgi:hypothetical protein
MVITAPCFDKSWKFCYWCKLQGSNHLINVFHGTFSDTNGKKVTSSPVEIHGSRTDCTGPQTPNQASGKIDNPRTLSGLVGGGITTSLSFSKPKRW